MKTDKLEMLFGEFSVNSEVLKNVNGGIYMAKSGDETCYTTPAIPGICEADTQGDCEADPQPAQVAGEASTNVHVAGSVDLYQLELCVVDDVHVNFA